MTAAALAGRAALGEEPARKTELVELDGTSVDIIQLRYDFDAAWVIDNRSLLYRDTSRDHYLVTLKEPCKQLDIRRRSFNFFPSWSWRLLSSNTYEVRHRARAGVRRRQDREDRRNQGEHAARRGALARLVIAPYRVDRQNLLYRHYSATTIW